VVIGWEREPFELLNKGSFRIADPGPLHAPIHSFSIRRNEKHQLLLETRAPADAKSSAPEYPSGILRLNTDTVELLNVSGIKATLCGVQPYNVHTRMVLLGPLRPTISSSVTLAPTLRRASNTSARRVRPVFTDFMSSARARAGIVTCN
jgi:hypothetical protein